MQLTDAQRLDWLRLIRTEGIGPRTFRKLVNRFGGAAGALDALPALTKRAGKPVLPPPRAEIEREMQAASRLGVRFLAMGEAAYPRALAVTDAAPPLLAVRGEAAVLARPALALVGSRNASAAGVTLTERLARALGESGLVVVSGLARGIDAAAHRASLSTGTVAVLAGGHDRIAPANHAELAARILEAGGALVAELPMGWEPRGRDFPRRNRIISGLALGTLVVEAARRSGSLITARYALEQGREVMAVPGSPLDPRAEGTNDLIRQGATLVAEADHVLAVLAPLIPGDAFAARDDLAEAGAGEPRGEADYWDELDLDGTGEVRPNAAGTLDPDGPGSRGFDPGPGLAPDSDDPPPDERARLLACLSPTPLGIDAIARAAGLPVRVVQTTLLELELDGRVERHGSGTVSLHPGRG